MDDGREAELGAGDAHRVGPGHDGWVVGDGPCVVIDVLGAETFALNGASEAEGVRTVTCPPCGVSFSVAPSYSIDHLVAVVQEHARASHGAELTREHILEEVTVAPVLAAQA
jgi:predicted small metal-binding protein